MKRSTLARLSILALGILALAWAPWLTPGVVRANVESAFEAAWDRIPDGCGLACENCGVHDIRWVPFGRTLELEFACGLIPEDRPEFHETRSITLSSLGTVHGLPRP